MKIAPYDTVTALPILIPAKLIPGERSLIVDTFRLHLPPIHMPRRIGEPGPEIVPWLPPSHPLLKLELKDLSEQTVLGRKIWKKLGPQYRNRVLQLMALRVAIEGKTGLAAITQAYVGISEQIWGPRFVPSPKMMQELARRGIAKRFAQGRREREFASYVDRHGAHRNIVAALVTNGLQNARLVLWWTRSRLFPAIWCPDLETAIFVLMLLPWFADGKGIAACLWCKAIFLASRCDQLYCCGRHREADRVSRWREKQRKIRRNTKKISNSSDYKRGRASKRV